MAPARAGVPVHVARIVTFDVIAQRLEFRSLPARRARPQAEFLAHRLLDQPLALARFHRGRQDRDRASPWCPGVKTQQAQARTPLNDGRANLAHAARLWRQDARQLEALARLDLHVLD